MEFRFFKPTELTPDLWAAIHRVRDANASYDDPMFDPGLALILGELRNDTRIVIAFENDTPVAFWPMHMRSGWARPLGGPFSDWHAPIMSKSVNMTADEFLERAGVGGMTVHGFSPCGFGPVAPSRTREMAHMTDVSAGYDHFLESQTKLFPKHYKKMRRLGRNLERDHSEVVFQFNDPDTDAVARLLARKSEQFRETGRHDVLAPAWAKAYVDRVQQLESPRFRVVMSTLRIDGEVAAAELNMASDTVLHGWLTGFDRKFSSFSPGLMLSDYVISQMPQLGLKLYDCGPGLGHYKKYLSNLSLPVETGTVSGVARNHPMRLVARAWRGAEGIAPEKIGNFLGKTRRRFDQILLAETDLKGRVKGVIGAVGAKAR